MQDDQQTRSGVFVTNQKGLVPPLVSTKFVVQDQGNASPRFIRSTMYNVPISQVNGFYENFNYITFKVFLFNCLISFKFCIFTSTLVI